MNTLDLLDAVNMIDRLGGLLYGLARHGQIGRTIRIAHSKGNTGNQWAALLARYGVDCWAKRATSTHLVFNVRAGQWQWAVDLLARAGAPVDHPARPWARGKPGQMPTPWADRRRP